MLIVGDSYLEHKDSSIRLKLVGPWDFIAISTDKYYRPELGFRLYGRCFNEIT